MADDEQTVSVSRRTVDLSTRVTPTEARAFRRLAGRTGMTGPELLRHVVRRRLLLEDLLDDADVKLL